MRADGHDYCYTPHQLATCAGGARVGFNKEKSEVQGFLMRGCGFIGAAHDPEDPTGPPKQLLVLPPTADALERLDQLTVEYFTISGRTDDGSECNRVFKPNEEGKINYLLDLSEPGSIQRALDLIAMSPARICPGYAELYMLQENHFLEHLGIESCLRLIRARVGGHRRPPQFKNVDREQGDYEAHGTAMLEFKSAGLGSQVPHCVVTHVKTALHVVTHLCINVLHPDARAALAPIRAAMLELHDKSAVYVGGGPDEIAAAGRAHREEMRSIIAHFNAVADWAVVGMYVITSPMESLDLPDKEAFKLTVRLGHDGRVTVSYPRPGHEDKYSYHSGIDEMTRFLDGLGQPPP